MVAEPCAGGIVLDEAGRLLMIRRGQEPSLGLWSIPGGRCLAGESREDACVREVAEETGMQVRVLSVAGRVELDAPGGRTYDVVDFHCVAEGGELRAGDDAIEVRWVTRAQLDELDVAPGLVAALLSWNLLPT